MGRYDALFESEAPVPAVTGGKYSALFEPEPMGVSLPLPDVSRMEGLTKPGYAPAPPITPTAAPEYVTPEVPTAPRLEVDVPVPEAPLSSLAVPPPPVEKYRPERGTMDKYGELAEAQPAALEAGETTILTGLKTTGKRFVANGAELLSVLTAPSNGKMPIKGFKYAALMPDAEKSAENQQELSDLLHKVSVGVDKTITDKERQNEQNAQDVIIDFTKNPNKYLDSPSELLKFASAFATNISVNAAPTLFSLIPYIGQTGMVGMEGGSWATQAKKEGVTDPDILRKGSLFYGVPAGLLETYQNRFIMAPLGGKKNPLAQKIAGKIGKLTDPVFAKIAAPVLTALGAGVGEAGEEITQNEWGEIMTAWALKAQAQKAAEAGQAEESIRLAARGREYVENAKGISTKTRPAVLAFFAGFGMGGGAVMTRAVGERLAGTRPAETPPAALSQETPAPAAPEPTNIAKKEVTLTATDENGVKRAITVPAGQDIAPHLAEIQGAATPQIGKEAAREAPAAGVESGMVVAPAPVPEAVKPPAIAPAGKIVKKFKPPRVERPAGEVPEADGLRTEEVAPPPTEAERPPELTAERAPATQEMPGIDNLTGLPNQNSIRHQVAAAEKDPNQSVLIFDIDQFKAVNDIHGHGVGDNVLSAVGKFVGETFGDLGPENFGRYGGEEFAVILPNTPESAKRVVEFMRSVPREVLAGGEPVTISGGFGPGRIPQEGGGMRSYADKLLYEAKKSGRNQLAIDKQGKTEYIVGTKIGEKTYATRHDIQSVEEISRRLLGTESLQAPEIREQLERTVQVLGRVGGGNVARKAGEGTAGKPRPEVSVKTPDKNAAQFEAGKIPDSGYLSNLKRALDHFLQNPDVTDEIVNTMSGRKFAPGILRKARANILVGVGGGTAERAVRRGYYDKMAGGYHENPWAAEELIKELRGEPNELYGRAVTGEGGFEEGEKAVPPAVGRQEDYVSPAERNFINNAPAFEKNARGGGPGYKKVIGEVPPKNRLADLRRTMRSEGAVNTIINKISPVLRRGTYFVVRTNEVMDQLAEQKGYKKSEGEMIHEIVGAVDRDGKTPIYINGSLSERGLELAMVHGLLGHIRLEEVAKANPRLFRGLEKLHQNDVKNGGVFYKGLRKNYPETRPGSRVEFWEWNAHHMEEFVTLGARASNITKQVVAFWKRILASLGVTRFGADWEGYMDYLYRAMKVEGYRPLPERIKGAVAGEIKGVRESATRVKERIMASLEPKKEIGPETPQGTFFKKERPLGAQQELPGTQEERRLFQEPIRAKMEQKPVDEGLFEKPPESEQIRLFKKTAITPEEKAAAAEIEKTIPVEELEKLTEGQPPALRKISTEIERLKEKFANFPVESHLNRAMINIGLERLKAEEGHAEKLAAAKAGEKATGLKGRERLRQIRDRHAMTENIRQAIYQYGRKLKLNLEPNNKLDILIKNAKNWKDFTAALDQIDRTAMERQKGKLLEKVRGEISNHYKQYGKGQAGKAEYKGGDALHNYMENLTANRGDFIGETDRLLDNLKNMEEGKGEDVADAQIDKIFAMNIESMDAMDLAGVLRDIKRLKEGGKTEAQVREMEEAAEHRTVLPELLEVAAEKTPREKGEELTQRQQVQKEGEQPSRFNQVKKAFLRPDVILQEFTGLRRWWRSKSEESRWEKKTWRKIFDAAMEKYRLQEKYGAKVDEVIKLAGGENELFKKVKINEPIKIGEDGMAVDGKYKEVEYSVNELMEVYAQSRNAAGRLHLEGTAMDAREIREAGEALSPGQRKAVEEMQKFFDDEVYPALAAEWKKRYRTELIKEENYFPILKLSRESASGAIRDMLYEMAIRNTIYRAGVDKSRALARKNSALAFKKFDFIGKARTGLMQQAHMISMLNPVDEVGKLLRTDDIRKVINEIDPEGLRSVETWLADLAIGRESASRSLSPSIRLFEEGLRYFRTASAVAQLGFKMVTPLMQLPALPFSARYVNKGDMAWAVGKYVKDVAMAIPNIKKAIFDGDQVAIHNFIIKYSSLVRERYQNLNREIAEIVERVKNGKLGTTTAWRKFGNLAMNAIRLVDMFTVDVTWMAKFREVMRETGDIELSRQKADEVMYKTQQMGSNLFLPEFYRGNEFMRTLTLYTNSINMYANRLYETVKGAREYGKEGGEGAISDRVQFMAWNMLVASAMFALIQNGFDPRKLVKDRALVVKSIVDNFNFFPVLNQIVDFAVQRGLNEWRKTYGVRPQKIQGGLNVAGLQGVVESAEFFKNPSITGGLKAASGLLGIPGVQQAVQSYKGYKEASEKYPGEPGEIAKNVLLGSYRARPVVEYRFKNEPQYEDALKEIKEIRAKYLKLYAEDRAAADEYKYSTDKTTGVLGAMTKPESDENGKYSMEWVGRAKILSAAINKAKDKIDKARMEGMDEDIDATDAEIKTDQFLQRIGF